MVATAFVELVEANWTLLEGELRAFAGCDGALSFRHQLLLISKGRVRLVSGSCFDLLICKRHTLMVIGWMRNDLAATEIELE